MTFNFRIVGEKGRNGGLAGLKAVFNLLGRVSIKTGPLLIDALASVLGSVSLGRHALAFQAGFNIEGLANAVNLFLESFGLPLALSFDSGVVGTSLFIDGILPVSASHEHVGVGLWDVGALLVEAS